MTATDLATVMDNIGTALGTVSGLRVFDFPPQQATPPFAFVDLPETIEYDLTMRLASNRYTLKVYVGVGNQLDRNARDAIAAYAAPSSIKAAIEGIGSYVRVTQATFSQIGLAGASYPGVVFTVDVAA